MDMDTVCERLVGAQTIQSFDGLLAREILSNLNWGFAESGGIVRWNVIASICCSRGRGGFFEVCFDEKSTAAAVRKSASAFEHGYNR